MPKLPSLKKPESLSKIAYEALRHSILSGQLKKDEIYSEVGLAKDLGISRTPVREALLELASKGYVTFLPRRGVMIKSFTQQDIEEIFELRKALETLVVEKVARTRPLKELKEIERILHDQQEAVKYKDYLAFLHADRAFHTSFSKLTSNRRLVAIMENLRDMIDMMSTQALYMEGRADAVIAEHQRVLEAVKRGKPAEAWRAMEHHLEQSKDAVVKGSLREYPIRDCAGH